MTDDTKQLLQAQLVLLKQTMKENGVIFGFLIDGSDFDNSKLCFMDKEEYFSERKRKGICISLTELNRELL